ncbi:hypothetical protein PanWU01x14_313640 [Parasponia andersonii]|uniref:Uncharacterized protein n=1 Tax=Parasponia andersonii TaxID=3476 RepID=A0A2P5AP17_PARAD|nr:hypothetical protein PanWU01x14_313640 [Parasponia andersonii]
MKGSSSGFGFGSRVPSSLMVNTWKNENNNRSVKDHEDLTLFREMNNRNRDKDGVISLLHPLSDEFDHSLIPLPNPNAGTGSDQLYRIPSSKKGSISAIDFLAENDKNDYDWLKTPPATPLFPSIEMEATATDGPQLIIPTQREIPILHPLSRVSLLFYIYTYI